MPNAVTHVLIVIIVLSLFRDYFIKNKKTFPLHYVLIGGIAGLLPDLDVAIYYILSFFGFTLKEVHRTFSHNLLVVVIFITLGFFMYGFKNHELSKHHLKLRNLFFVVALGVFVHLILDATLSGVIMPFYPFSEFSIGLNLVGYFPQAWQDSFMPSLDALLLVLWLIYLELKHRLSDFI